ncbi:MAG: hypothetical protein ACO2PN_20100 [Pyrobaculum sp.]|jgi:hypothetical protein
MMAEYIRLAIAASVVVVMIAVAVTNYLILHDDVVKIAADSLVVAKHIEIVNGTCPEFKIGPFESDDCIRQAGGYYVAYLPPKTIARVKDGWVIGLYQKVE